MNALVVLPAPPTSGLWFIMMSSSARKIVLSALDRHVGDVLNRGMSCLTLGRPAAPRRQHGTPRTASSTRRKFLHSMILVRFCICKRGESVDELRCTEGGILDEDGSSLCNSLAMRDVRIL
mmetsp:Transcript_24206/g.55382  ORF Transcript_24206/g.55382 Transcript_24206/m.55382 type:complete len:121 (+) Transcript_24206:483-845(+)